MENDFLDLKLKLRGKGLFDLFLARETKNDFIELIKQSDEIIVQPARSSLVEMAKTKNIKNNVILTKNELKQALGLPSKQDKTMKKPYVFLSPVQRFEFATRKEAMKGTNLCSVSISNAMKNGKIVIDDVEFKCERK